MALRSVMSSKLPMVIVLGATGTGKTKLGVELAQKFVGEIISADSMQIYKGLDVVTAKASREDQALARHHLLDILEPHQMFTVVDFRNRALKIIDNLIDQGKMPIVVGGTNYYIESIVYKILVENMNDEDVLLWEQSRKRNADDSKEVPCKKLATEVKTENSDATTVKLEPGVLDKASTSEEEPGIDKEKLKEVIENEDNFTNEELHEKLKAVDPVMAAHLHPNNRRKVVRSIEVWLKTGRLHSDFLCEQKLTEGQLRRPDSTIILWLKCEQKVHDERLDARVDAMLEAGLIEELLDFHARHNQHRMQEGIAPDYTKGCFQTLGFKEFHDYLMLSQEERDTEKGKKLLKESIECMKLGTKRYARRQNKMVKGRFWKHSRREVPPIYELDTTDISKWDENVKNMAIHIVESYLYNTTCSVKPLESDVPKQTHLDVNSYNYCEVCQRIFIGDSIYAIHLKSNKHMKVQKLKNLKASA